MAVIILLPLVLGYFLKSNAALGFLSLCGGYSLQAFASTDISSLLNKVRVDVSVDTVSVLLLAVPPVLTLVLCRGPSSRKITKPKVALNLLAALALGATFALMAVPLFGNIGGTNLTDAGLWTAVEKAQTEIIAIGVVLSLVIIWLSHRKPHATNKSHK